MGGSKSPETNGAANLLVLCGSGTTGCHGIVESNREDAMQSGLILRQSQTPSEVAVLINGGWFMLDNDGNKTPA